MDSGSPTTNTSAKHPKLIVKIITYKLYFYADWETEIWLAIRHTLPENVVRQAKFRKESFAIWDII